MSNIEPEVKIYPDDFVIPQSCGITGSRAETKEAALATIEIIKSLNKSITVVTGACVGVDSFAAEYAHLLGMKVHTILPASRIMVDPHWMRWATTYEYMPPGTTYRDRNVRLVNRSRVVIGIPMYTEDDEMSRRSGTWQTIRIARKAKKLYAINIIVDEET